MDSSIAVSAPHDLRTVACVGTGVIGRSWLRVFARAGLETRAYDPDPAQLDRALSWIDGSLATEVDEGSLASQAAAAERSGLVPCETLEDALAEAAWVQECGPEALENKRALFAELDGAAEAGAILASSTSAHDMTEIARGIEGARRCLVAHPVNPPHLIPVVEVLPGERTDPAVLDRAIDFLASVGQRPVRMHRYARGFLLNRLQAALVREAMDLVASGVADVDAVDTVVREGLGLRWAFLGPFGTGNTNADDGVAEYFTRYRAAYLELMADLSYEIEIDDALLARIGRETAEMERGASVADMCEWRDRMIRRLRALKRQDPYAGDAEPPADPAAGQSESR